MYLNVETYLYLFLILILAVLCNMPLKYGEITVVIFVEKFQLDFCKRLLGVKKSVCNVMILTELGRLPLHVIRKFKILSKNCIY